MECYRCGATLSEVDFCTACGENVKRYKKIMYASNRFYNSALERAGVRDLSGAVKDLKQCLKLNKHNIDARNLLGLIYFEMGEAVQGLSEWVISKNMKPEANIADEYINRVQSSSGRLETINNTIKKYNKALELANDPDSHDMAIIQLKKVLSMNPKYVQARKLLGLLYLERNEHEKAIKEFERGRIVDAGDVDFLRYIQSAEQILHPTEEKKPKNRSIFEENSARTFTSGNEVIIQPINDREHLGIGAFIQIGIGIVIGLCVTYFLIVPSRIQTVKDEMAVEISEYGETIDRKNAEATELENRVAQLEQDNLTQREQIEKYEGTNGAVDANNYLISATLAYLNPDKDSMDVEEYINLIGADYIENTSSYEFRELYELLLGEIGDNVSDSYYEAGLKSLDAEDYGSAIRELSKAYTYNSNSDETLYYLAMAYYKSGDTTAALEKFNELINAFPTSNLSELAKQRVEEMGY